MKKQSANYGGLLLIMLGGLALLQGTIGPLFGWNFSLWRFWPLIISVIGLAFIAVPFLSPQQRHLRWLFIPGLPILVVSSLLLLSSIFTTWAIWEHLWPMMILGLAVGFLAASVFLHNIWLMIPAIIIGVNGLLFQFCAITGLWELWAILWTAEPLAVGLALLVASAGKRPRLMRAGLIVSAVAVGSFSLMSFVLSGWVSMVGAVLLIVVGAGLVVQGRAPILLHEKSPDEKLMDGLKF